MEHHGVRTALTPKQRRGRAGTIGLLALGALMAFVVWRSLQIGGMRCEVCITYGGRSQCRTVDGATREDALEAARTNVCAFLSSGVTDSMACARTPPDRTECVAPD